MPHKLLLADDSVTIQRVIELTFADEDVQVSVVGDGKQAIESIRRDRPDIVLADIGMPERDGYEVASFIKNDPDLAHIPVVLLTGAFEPIDENRARSVRCDGVLVKPFEPQMVINRVKELLAGQRPAGWAPATASARVEIESDLAPSPQPAPAAGIEQDSLEDYFDRLDAVFANIGTPPRLARPVLEEEDLAAGLGDLHQPPPQRSAAAADPMTSWDPELSAAAAPARQPHLANAFAVLLAAEEGTPLPAAVLTAPETIPEETIDEIVRRVLARMADDSMRRMVGEIAERLVREEIDRIKRMSTPGDHRG
jgi:CheY-like chemotaxis protein